MKLKRYSGNPIMTPLPHHRWESHTVFNAAVVQHNGVFHMLYRAQGEDRISRLGYAVSRDGLEWSRLDRPVFAPEADFETYGVEDPRITEMDGTFYMCYTGYSAQGTRSALACSQNLIAWQRLGVVLPDEDNKDHVLFPQRIGGRYCMFHRRPPDIWLAYSDDLLHWTDHQVIMRPRPGLWDSVRIGAAGPPVRIDAGWLVIYHGYDQAHVYCLGVALLDLKDPARVLSRPEPPILVPEMPWEVWGDVPRVIFSCANLVVGDELWVYYGGGDRVMAMASAPLADLLAFLR
jgi:predicted GH43/DUF377 family glycosyl hydrolase